LKGKLTMTTQTTVEPGSLELHIIQNFPPSNLNRDDVGQPKDCDFGGFRRARISSQCLKRSIRYVGKDFQDKDSKSIFERYTRIALAMRTKHVIDAIVARLVSFEHPEEQANDVATEFASAYAGGITDGETNVLIYLSTQEIEQVAQEIHQQWDRLSSLASAETPLQTIARQFVEKIAARTEQPAKGTGIAAKDLGKELQARLKQNGYSDKETQAVTKGLNGALRELKNATRLYTKVEIDWLAELLTQQWNIIEAHSKKESPLLPLAKKLAQDYKNRTCAPDIALFGRMLAGKTDTNIDAACQVAHAISTHTLPRNEMDYFTAVDDFKQIHGDLLEEKEKTGAGFLDVAYFNSACFYRYACIDLTQLQRTLMKDSANTEDQRTNRELLCDTVEAFLRASEAAIPSGKKNSYAQEVRPSFMLAVLRSKQSAGWGLFNAFERPIRANDDYGLLEQSVRRLDQCFTSLRNFYDDNSVMALAVALPDGRVTPDILSEELQKAVILKLNGWINTIVKPLSGGPGA
jgi:CRISPR system Cascade subunit CasC